MPETSKYKRFNVPGHAHSLTFSCFRRQPFLKSDRAKQYLADSVNASRARYHFHVWAWVFMPEHIHVLIFPVVERYSISDILKSIKQPVAGKMIKSLKEGNPAALKRLDTGLARPRYRFWQDGGGYDRNYWTRKEILEQVEYVHNNPVMRGLVKDPCEWAWSSARAWLRDERVAIPIDKGSLPPI